MSDNFILRNSQTEASQKRGLNSDRYFQKIVDNNYGSYQSQILWDNLASLSTMEAVLSLKESFLEIPYIVHVGASKAKLVDIAKLKHAVGLKGYMNLIASVQFEVDHNVVLNVTKNSEIINNFEMLTSFSQDDLQTKGKQMNFQHYIKLRIGMRISMN